MMIQQQKASKYTFRDLTTIFSSVGNVWLVDDLVRVAAGTDIDERYGRRIAINSIALRSALSGGQSNVVSDDVYNVVRVVICLASDTLVAGDWNGTVGMGHPPIVGLFPKVHRFLYDKTFVICTYGLDSAGYIQRVIPVEKYLQQQIPLQFDGVAATDHSQVSIFMGVISDSAAVSNPGFVTSSYLTMAFKDVP